MATITRDGVLVKKLIVGILAAGTTGAVAYYGYVKWKSRSPGGPESEKKTPATQQSTDLGLKGPEEVSSDPTPILQPENVTKEKSDSLSVSESFEKVSLSNAPDKSLDGQSAAQNISGSFENVPIPKATRLQNRDAPQIAYRPDGSGVVSPSGGRAHANGHLKMGEQAPRSRTEMKVEMPGAVKGQPAKSGVSSVSISQSPDVADDDDDDDDDDDNDNETDSDGSGDSQVKDE